MKSRQQLDQLAAALDGVPVLGCLPNSPAARAGVRYGDILLSANGRPTPRLEDYIEARNERQGSVELRLFRDGSEFVVTLECKAPSEEVDPLTGLEAIQSFFSATDQFGSPAAKPLAN
jgi:S1-C subfamily serine protease